MFLVDKHYNLYNKIINYDMLNNIFTSTNYNTLHNIILYGSTDNNKEHLIHSILEHMFNPSEVKLKDIEYTTTNIKLIIKQSKRHIIIEPNTNNIDKYIIHDIIQNYITSESLNTVTPYNMYKIIIINKIYNLSFYAQSALWRTIEKYNKICKFILITNQLTQVIDSLRSRCITIRIPLPTNNQILDSILNIAERDNIQISFNTINQIIKHSDNHITHAVWLLDMHKYGITDFNSNWHKNIYNIISLILNKNTNLTKVINKIHENFYILYITNIPITTIIIFIMNILLKQFNNIKLKYNIINLTSLYNIRLIQGKRAILHFDAYIINLIKILYKY